MHAHMRTVTVHNASITYIEEQLSLTICYENRIESIKSIVDWSVSSNNYFVRNDDDDDDGRSNIYIKP